MKELTGWIGVDLDGTLAEYDGWRGVHHIGKPVPKMLERVRQWLAEGKEVRIFTARVGPQNDINDNIRAREAIAKWCVEHLGQELPMTATKDFAMLELWDDRSRQVMPNTGISYEELWTKAALMMANLENPEEVKRLLAEYQGLHA